MYTEIKYLNLLSTQLSKFKHKGKNLWNFRCPICGDSQRNTSKARGFVFIAKTKMIYKCHNCGVSMSLDTLIERVNPVLYKQYRLEKFQESGKTKKPDMRKVKSVVSKTPVFKTNPLKDLIKIDNLNNSHPAVEYLTNRKLPTSSLYFTEKFQEWVNSVKPNSFTEIKQDEPRIIIPFIDKEGVVFGFQGRSLSNNGLRYITILLEEDRQKIFGLNTIDENRRIYITEGPFDSLLLWNSVAMAGADVSDISNLGNDCVFVYDNEPRNREITKRISKHISAGHQVVLWPSTLKEKDINDMHLSGVNVQDIVDNNVYTGLTAKVKFENWKR